MIKTIRELYQKLFPKKEYALKVTDIFTKRDKIMVTLQCFFSNTFMNVELSEIVNNNDFLEKISPKEVRLLSEINTFYKKRKYLALSDEGAFVYSDKSENFFTVEELKVLVEDDSFVDSLDQRSAYLLGYLIGSKNPNTDHNTLDFKLIK